MAIIRLIRHMTPERGVVAEHRVLQQRLPRAYSFEEVPHMRPQIVVIVSFITDGLGNRLLSWLGVVLRVPLLEVCIFQARGKPVTVVAGGEVNASLRNVSETKFAELKDALRTHEARNLCRFGS